MSDIVMSYPFIFPPPNNAHLVTEYMESTDVTCVSSATHTRLVRHHRHFFPF